ncbi:MAG TPA: 2-phospho-L-lactate guanylyltransferase [Lacisediminihabitans sp.]|uniref:2-phospho-L-lactate guanylyltransferase n=1 Tax=Lacisediminihabitans sp. TaxID=2787631 RepID=UPI002ED8AF0D
MAADWLVVIPVKGTAAAKSRFGGDPARRMALATAIAQDTVAAALSTPVVDRVFVVTSEAASVVFERMGAEIVVERDPRGLMAAVDLGIERAWAAAGQGQGVAVLLGDLPALVPGELESALVAAGANPLAIVPDAEGLGTVLITARAGETHAPAFGPGSSSAHRAAGYLPLDVPEDSGLRNDVDTVESLRGLSGRLGPRTAAALAESEHSSEPR